MGAFRQDPYLWVHLAGLALVPLCLDACLAGLASARQVMPMGIGIPLLVGLGVLPILWMQWQRPFYIFSLGVLTLRPAELTDTQRRLLVIFKTWPVRLLNLLGAVGTVGFLWWLYKLAPLTVTATPLLALPRIVGFAIAILAFLLCNLFIQVPLSVLGVLLTQARQVEQITPYALSNIPRDFTLVGLRTHRLLPAIAPWPPSPSAPETSVNLEAAVPDTTGRQPQQSQPSSPEAVQPHTPATEIPETSVYEEHDADDPWL
jgi:hypothetical protein